MLKLFLAFTLIPALELYLLVQLGSRIGVLTTIFMVIVTGILGAGLARLQGWETLQRITQALREQRFPAEEMVDGVLIFAAGLVLITPGFLTDLAGLLLLFPPTRYPVRKWLVRKFAESEIRRHSAQTGSRPQDDDDLIIQQ
ncbi:MAG: FxsA family protein [bacterium]|jgi:UPF0716 protein FxsA